MLVARIVSLLLLRLKCLRAHMPLSYQILVDDIIS